MQLQCIDLSVPLETSISEPEPVQFEYIDHQQGALLLLKESGINADSFPDGLAVNLERIKLTSHSGTHVDAPLHYGPLCEGVRAQSIDELPLEWFFGTALVLDCSLKQSEETVSAKELQQAQTIQGLSLNKGDIVFINTGANKLWGRREYFTHFRGISLEATDWLLDCGIKVIGVDSFGFDAPFHKMIQAFQKTGNQHSLWPCHMLGRRRKYCQIERLTNLEALPTKKKFKVSCFPIKLKGCGGGPARVVALLNDEIN